MNITFVGCGGLFWHGLTQATQWIHRREPDNIKLIDEDSIQDSNVTRQWGRRWVKSRKVIAARYVLEMSIPPTRVEILEQMLMDDPKVLLPETDILDDLWVFCLPDNHLCRLRTHASCNELAKQHKITVTELFAGNGLVSGGAVCCRHRPDGTIQGDWTKRHSYILEEAKLELERLAHPQTCGGLSEQPEQSVQSNAMTAFCIWTLAEEVAQTGNPGEMHWELNDEIYTIKRRQTDVEKH